MKTQVVKNDGCVRWIGAIHEDFEATRDINPYFIEGIERIHLSEGQRIERSKERNLEISLIQAKKNPDDPRSYWNLGNAHRALEHYRDAMAAFETFLNLSRSDEEKYLCRLRRAECLWATGDKFKAIDEARYAIGTKPDYPDAYNLLGGLYLETQQYQQAIEIYLQGLVKKPPVYKILVYNPRDYDYQPMKNLAKAFWMANRPDMARPLLEACLKVMPTDKATEKILKQLVTEEKTFNEALETGERLKKIKDPQELQHEIAKLPVELQSHPAIAVLKNTSIIKTTSSGKDLVFYCGNTGEVWNPETAKEKGIGGSEEAVIWLSKLLAKRGWNVEVYANCGTEEKLYEGVKWKPFWTWNLRDKQDVLILWRHPAPLKFDINADRIYLDTHDALKDGEFTPERLKKITKVFVKSRFHRSLFPSIPDEKIAIVPNGINSSLFQHSCPHKRTVSEDGNYNIDRKCEECAKLRDPMLMVNTSSAERSLPALLDCYEEIKKKVPTAKLQWAYGWTTWDLAHSTNPKMMEMKNQLIKRMNELGVEQLGRISHDEVAKLYLRANIFAYPTEFAEIDCISLSKALAAGALPITTDFAALGEKQAHGGIFIHSTKTKDTWGKPYQIDFSLDSEKGKTQFVSDAIRFLKNPPSEETRQAMREWAQFTFDWERIADQWDKELSA
jgi:glycosyltransferase involved in cell wall biosynthesis/Tfp pilus assembly protein PilF